MTANGIEQTYDYKPLEPQHFRVVEFLPPLDGLVVRCKLVDYAIDDIAGEALGYSALSYTWGDHEKSEYIEIDGRSLPITWGLYYALQHLRSRHQRLWIDAVCIDQSNKKERERQVQEMKRIYERASMVIVWLGAATAKTNEVMDALDLLEKESLAAGQRWVYDDPAWKSAWSRHREQASIRDGSTSVREMFGLKDLMARSWFTRVWIIQEVAFARAAIVCCGSKSISGKMLSLAPSLLEQSVGQLRRTILDIMPGVPRDQSWWCRPRDLFSLLCQFSRSNASEPRDQIYALLNLSSGTDVSRVILPDYRSTDVEVVQKTILYLLGTSMESYKVNFKPRECTALWRLFDSYPTVSSLRENLDKLKSQILDFYGVGSTALNTTSLYELSTRRGTDAFRILHALLRLAKIEEQSITPHVFKVCAAHTECGHRLVQFLLDQQDSQIVVTEEILKAAVRNRYQGKAVVQLLVDRRASEIIVTQEIVEATAHNIEQGPAILQLLLSQRISQVIETEKMVLTILDSFSASSTDYLELLLNRRSSGRSITETVLKAASSNTTIGNELVELILDNRGSQTVITEAVLEAAASNNGQGEAIMQVLVDRKPSEVVVTERILMAAATNSSHEQANLGLRLAQRGSEVVVTESLISSVLELPYLNSHELLRLLLAHPSSSKAITADVLATAMRIRYLGDNIVRLILEQRGGETVVIEETLKSIARNQEQGIQILDLFLQCKGSETVETEELLHAAVSNARQGSAMVKLLLDLRASKFEVTQRILESTLENSAQAARILSLFTHREVIQGTFTEAFLEKAAANHQFGRTLMSLLLNHRDDKTVMIRRVLEVASKNLVWGHTILCLVIDKWPGTIEATEANLLMAIRAGHYPLLRFLLNQQGNEALTIQSALTAAILISVEDIKPLQRLLETSRDEIVITETELQLIVNYFAGDHELLLQLLDMRGDQVLASRSFVHFVLRRWTLRTPDRLLDQLITMGHSKLEMIDDMIEFAKSKKWYSHLLQILLNKREGILAGG